MATDPCPRCGSLEGRLPPVPHWVDASVCAGCGQTSTNCEWSRGKPWTEEEIAQMMETLRAG